MQEESINVGEVGEYKAPDIILRPGSTLTGYVLDVGGNPVPDARLDLDSAFMMGTDPRSPDRITAIADNTGRYEFKNVAVGSRNVTVSAEGYGLQVKHNLVFQGVPGDDLEHNFRLEPGHPIAGRVFGPDNEGIEGARILSLNYGKKTSSRGEAYSGPDGEFQIDGLQAGSYILLIEAKGYRAARANRVQVGDLDVQVEMIRQACIGGVVTDTSGSPVNSFICSIHSASNASAKSPRSSKPRASRNASRTARTAASTCASSTPASTCSRCAARTTRRA